VIYVPRVNYRQCLIPVRAFYLDLAQWAAGDPARWAIWSVPCPVSGEEISQRKFMRQRKARMDAAASGGAVQLADLTAELIEIGTVEKPGHDALLQSRGPALHARSRRSCCPAGKLSRGWTQSFPRTRRRPPAPTPVYRAVGG
jgi:hypothetical protein